MRSELKVTCLPVFSCPVGVDGPHRASVCQDEVVMRSQPREPSVEKLIRIGVDTSKSVFQLHGVNESENVVLRRKLQRRQMLSFFAQLEPTKVGMEACGGSHY